MRTKLAFIASILALSSHSQALPVSMCHSAFRPKLTVVQNEKYVAALVALQLLIDALPDKETNVSKQLISQLSAEIESARDLGIDLSDYTRSVAVERVRIREEAAAHAIISARLTSALNVRDAFAWRPKLMVQKDFKGRAQYTPDGRFLAIETARGLSLISAKTGEITHSMPFSGELSTTYVAGNGVLAVGIKDASTAVIARSSDHVVTEIKNPAELPIRDHDYHSKSGLFAIGRDFGRVEIWDLNQTRPVLVSKRSIKSLLPRFLQSEPAAPNQHHVRWLRFSPDGTALLVQDLYGTFYVVDARSGKLKHYLGSDRIRGAFGGSLRAFHVAMSPASFTIAIEMENSSGIRIYDANENRLLRQIKDVGGNVEGTKFSPDGSKLLVWGKFGAKLFEVQTGEVVNEYKLDEGEYPHDFSFAAMGTEIILTKSTGDRVIWGLYGKTRARWLKKLRLPEAGDPSMMGWQDLNPQRNQLAVSLQDYRTNETTLFFFEPTP